MRPDHKDISSFVLGAGPSVWPFRFFFFFFFLSSAQFPRNQPWRERKLAICRIAGIVLHRFEYFSANTSNWYDRPRIRERVKWLVSTVMEDGEFINQSRWHAGQSK